MPTCRTPTASTPTFRCHRVFVRASSTGHVTDKIELIVLGGTWTDYPESYRIWFVRALFRALNDGQEHSSAHDRNGRSDNGNDDSAAA